MHNITPIYTYPNNFDFIFAVGNLLACVLYCLSSTKQHAANGTTATHSQASELMKMKYIIDNFPYNKK